MFQALAEGFDLDRFLARLRGARTRLLLLDYDGCLAPFRTDRSRALPYPGVVERLAALQGSGEPRTGATRLALVSGRRAEEVRALVGLERPPEIWGCHGFEHLLTDGRRSDRAPGGAQVRALAAAVRALRGRGLGEMLERKVGSVAIHWRGLAAEDAAVVWREARDVASAVATALELRSFEGGLELRAPGTSKGTVVAKLVAEARPPLAVAYLGDDLTDEDAFAALPADGLGALVRPELRPTRARLWIRPPEELLAFLDLWLATTQSD